MGPFLERGINFRGIFLLERSANLESRVAHTHPKNTQVPPPPGSPRSSLPGKFREEETRETSPSTKTEKKRMFSQASYCRAKVEFHSIDLARHGSTTTFGNGP